MKAALIALSAWLLASSVAAQESDRWPLRLAGGVSLEVHVGPVVELNGSARGDDRPTNFMPIPSPGVLLRLEAPLHRNLVLGAQASSLAWETTGEQALGMSSHYGADVSAVARFRIPLGRQRRHELLGSLAFGPTFDAVEPGPRNYGETIETNVGWHVGPFMGWQYLPFLQAFGFFGEAGFTYHRLTHTIEYAIDGQRTHDEVTYQPVTFFVRGGFVLAPFY